MQRVAINPPGLLAATVGVALITLGFYVLVPVAVRDSVAWVGYGVFILVYLANLTNASLAGAKPSNFDAQIPRLGILWTAYSFYTILAIGGFFAGASALLPPRVLIFLELVLFVGLMVTVRIAGYASAHAVNTAASEAAVSTDLDTLRAAATECQLRLTRLDHTPNWEYQQFTRILDGIRYLSPSGQNTATSLESEIKALLLKATDEIAFAQAGAMNPSARQSLDRCEALLKLRQQQTRG